MLLKSLTLQNIRSYTNHSIEFPSGSVLLSGDIGSGKSTILLALEFALFGIKASELSGSMLLRNGKTHGKVALTFSLNGQDIVIERALKRTKQGVTQEPGTITQNGSVKEATATELRAIMFELLGYPQDLVSKSKDLIYRYTVYTPQEALKDILFEKSEDRLDTLRRVFTIDKYKRIRENAVILLSDLKEQRKVLEGYTSDIVEKKELQEQLVRQQQALLSKQKELKPKVAELTVQVEQKKLLRDNAQQEILALQQQKQQLAATHAQLESTITQFKQYSQELPTIENQLAASKPVEVEIDNELPDKIRTIKEYITQKEKAIRDAYSDVHTLQSTIKIHEETKTKITNLNHCPTCDQQVSLEHKSKISAREDTHIQEIKQKQVRSQQVQQQHEKEHHSLTQQLDGLEKKRREQEVLLVKKQHYESLLKRKQELAQHITTLKQQVGTLNAQKNTLNDTLKDYDAKELLWKNASSEHDKISQEHRHLELGLVSVQKEEEGVSKQLQLLVEEINKKEESITTLGHIKQKQTWISSFFINLMHTIEKQVMVQINIEFNEFFKQWFSVIMEDDTISVRIDDEFTPIVEQNGYETSLHNLSGGEKTSVALAYRLALHKVINDVVSEIKTKDLLILDEPTDGFSTEQLDNVRQVLDALDVAQLIVVSHEHKIESYVDHVLRVSKRDHESVVS